MDIISTDRTAFKGKNGKAGKGVVDLTVPYAIEVAVKGTETLLCHRWDNEAVKSKAGAKKGSAEKKSDNVESYVYRLPNGECGMPGINFKACLAEAAKYFQDPRSPRKSARDLMRAGIKVPGIASFGKKTWDYLDVRKVNVQRNAVARTRPAFLAGWELTYEIQVLTPEYLGLDLLNEIAVKAGRLVGLGDFRPDFGTFMVTRFEAVVLE